MALNALGRIEVVFRFQDRSRPGVESAKKGVKSLATAAVASANTTRNAFVGAFPAIIALGVVRQIAQAVGAFVRPAAQLRDSMRRVAAFANLGTESFAEFKGELLEFAQAAGLEVGISTSKVVDAFVEMSKKGIPARDALASLVSVTRLARVGNIEVTESAEAAVKLFRVWGATSKDLTTKLDQLALVASKSSINFDELTGLIARSSGAVAVAEPRFAELLFVLAATRDTAASAALTATQVRRAYEFFAQRANRISGELDVAVREKAGGAFRDLSQIMFEIAERDLPNFSVEISKLTKILGTKSVKPIQALALAIRRSFKDKDGIAVSADVAREAFFKLRKEIDIAGIVVEELSTKQVKANLIIQMDRLRVATEQVRESFGVALLAPLLGAVDAFTDFFVITKRIIDAITDVTASNETVVQVFGAMLQVFGTVTAAATTFFGVLLFGRAVSVLFGAAIKFTTFSLFANSIAIKGMAADQLRAVASSTALGRGLLGVGASALTASRAVRLFSLTLGPLGIFAAVMSTLVIAFDLFGSDIDKLDKTVADAKNARDSAAARLFQAGDLAGAAFLRSAAEIKSIFKKPPTLIKESLIDQIPRLIARLRETDPTLGKQAGTRLESQAIIAAGAFKEFKAVGTSEDPDAIVGLIARTNLQQAAKEFAFILSASSDKQLQQAGKDFQQLATGLSAQGETQEAQARLLDEIRKNTEATAKKLGADLGLAGGRTGISREDRAAALAELGGSKAGRSAQARALGIDVRPGLGPFGEKEARGELFGATTGFDFFESIFKFAETNITAGRKRTTSKDPNVIAAQLIALNRLVEVTQKMERNARLGNPVKVTVDNLAGATGDATGKTGERNLDPEK